ncbi:MAG TPA: GLUG motif-containing protein [Pirellulales bacterium]|nr:GLUG motif-containing protein [Pirellulales bacterium]
MTGTNTSFNFGVGGLVGYMYGGAISQSYATGSVSAPDYVGGLVGWTSGGKISQSYAIGAVSGVGNVGGLIGYNNSIVTQTFAAGAVTGTTPSTTGGLVGVNDANGTVTTSYWDTTIGLTNGYGTNNSEVFTGQGLATSKFGTASTFSGWNFGKTPGGPSCSDEGACWVIVDSDGTLNNNFPGSFVAGATRPMLLSEWSPTITNPHQLQLMALDLSADYTLANSINLGPSLSNASNVWGPNGSAGFVPIGGNAVAAFTGSLNGNGNTISNLTINSASLAFVGLFGEIGSNGAIHDVGLVGGSVSGGMDTGALAGINGGTLTNVYETGAVTAAGSARIVGGLVGSNLAGGTIAQSYATGQVTAGDLSSVGGLVGENFSSISQSYATGALAGGDFAFAGGLVGENFNSISDSHATGAVTTGTFGTTGGLVGYNLSGTITQSYASGAVTVGANSFAGGLVGQNFTGASIANSHAIGAVSSAGADVWLGGLVGQNDPEATIINSQAFGAVTSTASLSPQNSNNNCFNVVCDFVNVGGFVGANFGTITGATWTTAPANCAASFTCAAGNVSVGALGQGGGFAGYNEGIFRYAFATGNVTGAAGLPDTVNGNVFDNTTQIAGFVANNHGQIVHAFATGKVGTAGTMWLSAAGFAGNNEGTIDASFATGAVTAGDNSTVGGFVQSNAPDNFSPSCPGCFTGDAFNNSAAISNSQAFGNVTVGAFSAAGGFATIAGNGQGVTGGSFTNVSASGAVNAGHDSIVGGLIAVLGASGTILNSAANNTAVASSGANSIVGGVAGLNEGTISDTSSTAPVSGTSDSYIGGVAGINLGLVTGASTDPAVGGSGGNNFVGGIAGLNVGSIDNSNGQVDLASGTPNYTGGVAGVNAAYTGTQGTIPNSSFPNGTITNSSSSGSGFTNQVGTSSPSFIPGLPSWLAGCTDAACTALTGGSVQQGTTPSNPPPSNSTPNDSTPSNTISLANQQVLQFTQPNFTPTNIAPPLIDPTTLASLNAGTPGNAGSGPGNGPNNSGNGGSLANGRQGGNGAPPGTRLIDMHIMPLPPGSGLPPPGETRFLSNQLVLQFGPNMTQQQITALAQRFGLTIVSQQSVGSLGRTIYTFQIGNGQTVPALIQAINTAGFNAAAQPNYSYALSQDLSGTSSSPGDPAQYIVKKLQLGAVHRITKAKTSSLR